MKKLFCIFSLIFAFVMVCHQPVAQAEIVKKSVGLVVLDYNHNVDKEFYKKIYSPVKVAYNSLCYNIIEDKTVCANVSAALDRPKLKVTPELLQQLAEQNKVDVLVVARIYDVRETYESSFINIWDGPESRTRVTCYADLHCYRADSKKLLSKRIRESFAAESGSYEKPEDTVRWQLSKLVNTMEGLPVIGRDI